MLDRGTVLGVHERGPFRQRRERLVEALLLLLAAAVVQLGRMEVREDAGRTRAREDVAVPAHVIPSQPRARHPGVDLEMPIAPGAGPRLDHGRIAERRREIGATQRVDLGAEDGGEDDDRPRDAAAAQLLAFGDRRRRRSPRVEILERECDVKGAEAVRRRPSPWAGAARRRAPRRQPRCGATRARSTSTQARVIGRRGALSCED